MLQSIILIFDYSLSSYYVSLYSIYILFERLNMMWFFYIQLKEKEKEASNTDINETMPKSKVGVSVCSVSSACFLPSVL